MAALAKMRQLEERQVEKEIQDMLWSPKMDILALQWKSGQEVSLYRLNWQRLWSASPPTEESRSTCLVWRPDGKLLAVGYSSGHLSVLDVESHIPLCNHQVDGPVSCFAWTSLTPEIAISSEDKDDTKKEMAARELLSTFSTDGWDFLTNFPSLSKAYSGSEDKEECQKLHDGGLVTLLAAGTKNGKIHLFMNGFLPCSMIDLNILTRCPCDMTTISMLPHQFATFSAICTPQSDGGNDIESKIDENSVKLVAFSVPLLASCVEELKIISKFYCIIRGILNYMKDTLNQIQEAWESVLLEMDSKLESYAQKLPEDGMAADFLELLMFGVPSPELESFLQTDLTEKGLKKFDHAIEVSYSNIQRLVLTYLNTVSQSLNFHLAELIGHCRANNKFETLGVQEAHIVDAERCAASFWSKGIEVQQVLDESMKSFKAFFRWLSVEIRRLSELCLAEDLTKVSQQEVRFIADFLDSFSTSDDKPSKVRYLEKVGQYLKGDVISQPLNRSDNPWFKFLQDNKEIRDLPFIIFSDETSSPLKEFDRLSQSIDLLFSGLNLTSTADCQLLGDLQVSTEPAPSGQLSSRLDCRQFECVNSGKILGLVMQRNEIEPDLADRANSKDKILFYELDVHGGPTFKALCLSLEISSSSKSWMQLIDGQFYTSEMISLLLESSEDNEEHQRMIQLNHSLMEPYLVELKFSSFQPLKLNLSRSEISTMSVFDVADESCHRDLEHLIARQFAVSGLRKVAAFLFRNKRRIRIYDMEAEEEDPEDETLGTSGISSELNTST